MSTEESENYIPRYILYPFLVIGFLLLMALSNTYGYDRGYEDGARDNKVITHNPKSDPRMPSPPREAGTSLEDAAPRGKSDFEKMPPPHVDGGYSSKDDDHVFP